MATTEMTDAVVFTGIGEVTVEEVPLPRMGPGDVVVEIEYSSISTGTERWCLVGKHHEPGEPPLSPFPFIPGYQGAGVVIAAGGDVTDVAVGDRVFSATGRVADGGPDVCWGGHMRHHVVAGGDVLKLPPSVSTRKAAGLLLAQVGFNGATQPQVERGDVALVIGDGLVGQYAAQVFRQRGAHVVLSGHHDERLQLASRYGAHEVVNSLREDLPAYVRERWPEGVHVAAESAGRNELIRTAIDLLVYNGQLVLLGYYPEGECMIDIHWVRARETTVWCPNSSTRQRMEMTLEMLSRDQMFVEELVTHEFPFTDAPKAYRMTVEKGEDFLGIVLNWTGTRR